MNLGEIFSKDHSSQEEDQNPISLLSQPQKFYKYFEDVATKSFIAITSQEYEEAILYLTKLQDLHDLGKQTLKGLSPYWKLCIFLNLAGVYQKQDRIGRCNKYCSKAQSQLQSLLSRQSRSQFLLNFLKILLKLKFQHCAVFSQLSRHNEALEICREIFVLIESYLSNIVSFIKKRPSSSSNKFPKTSAEAIVFQEKVAGYAEETINNLICSLQKPICQKEICTPFYFWTRNPQKNEEQITKMFLKPKPSQDWGRTILGVSKPKQKITELSIGAIMHIQKCDISSLDSPPPLAEYLFKEQVHQSIIFTSMAYFTLATQLRFIEENSKKNHDISLIYRKYGYEEKSDAYRLSQMYHLRAIDIISQNIQSSIPYLSHIIRSYERHYIINKPLEKIVAIPDESLISIAVIAHENKGHNLDSHKKDNQDVYDFQIPRKTKLSQAKLGRQIENKRFERKISDVDFLSGVGTTQPTSRQFQKVEQKRKNKSLGKTKRSKKQSNHKLKTKGNAVKVFPQSKESNRNVKNYKQIRLESHFTQN